jgi:hypothetical protein
MQHACLVISGTVLLPAMGSPLYFRVLMSASTATGDANEISMHIDLLPEIPGSFNGAYLITLKEKFTKLLFCLLCFVGVRFGAYEKTYSTQPTP